MGKFDFIYELDEPDFFIDIKRLITVYYFEFTKDYAFSGESHDFWELVYVDKGQITIEADGVVHDLQEGDIAFHKPNEFHRLWSNGIVAPNVLIISFISHSTAMAYFEEKRLKLSDQEKQFLGHFIREAKGAFNQDLGIIYDDALRLKTPVQGAEQLMYLHLQQLFISLIRKGQPQVETPSTLMLTQHFNDPTVTQIVQYFQQHLAHSLSLDDLSKEFYLSKTYLKNHFKNETSYSIMNYFKRLRMEEAKKLIREGGDSFTQIAQNVGFDSIHYFSTSFKQYTGSTPSEYARSIKALEKSMNPK